MIYKKNSFVPNLKIVKFNAKFKYCRFIYYISSLLFIKAQVETEYKTIAHLCNLPIVLLIVIQRFTSLRINVIEALYGIIVISAYYDTRHNNNDNSM